MSRCSGRPFSILKSSLRVTKWLTISLVCFPTEEKRGSALFPGRYLLFKNVRDVALLAALLFVVPATTLHSEVPRQSVGRNLRLSGIARLTQFMLFHPEDRRVWIKNSSGMSITWLGLDSRCIWCCIKPYINIFWWSNVTLITQSRLMRYTTYSTLRV